MTKEYIVAQTAHGKRSVFYHWDGQKKKQVSMTEAYQKHSAFGLTIREYKSGKLMKTHPGKKVKHTKSRRTKFGLVNTADMAFNIKSLAISDSAHHDFSNSQKKRINDGTNICLFYWQAKLDIAPANVLNEDQITNDYTTADSTTISSMHKRITFNGATEPHTFWNMPSKVTIDGNPNALPFCIQSDAEIPTTEDVKKSTWWGYKKMANTVISMFTLTDPQSTGDSVATDFLRSLTGGTPNEFVTTTWESPDTLPYTYTADRVRYTIQPDTQNGWSGVKKVFVGGTDWFRTVIVKVGESGLGIINIGTDITDQVIAAAAGANKLPPPGKIKRKRKYRYFGTYEDPQNYIVTGLVCEATILSARDIGHIIQNINAATFIANGSTIPKYDIITRLLEIKRLGDWGQVIHTGLVKDTVLVTKDRLCYYYAYLLSNSDFNIKPNVILSTTPGSGEPAGATHSYGVGDLVVPASDECKEYVPYMAGESNAKPKKDVGETQVLYIEGYKEVPLDYWIKDSDNENRYVKVFSVKPTPNFRRVGKRVSKKKQYNGGDPLTFTYMAFVRDPTANTWTMDIVPNTGYGHTTNLNAGNKNSRFNLIDRGEAGLLLPLLQDVVIPFDTILYSKHWDSFVNQVQQRSDGRKATLELYEISNGDFQNEGFTLPDFACVASDPEDPEDPMGFGVPVYVGAQDQDGPDETVHRRAAAFKSHLSPREMKNRREGRNTARQRSRRQGKMNNKRTLKVVYRINIIEQRLFGAIAKRRIHPKLEDILTEYYPYIFNDDNIKMTIVRNATGRLFLQYPQLTQLRQQLQLQLQPNFGKTVGNKANEKKKALAKLSRFGVTFRNGKFKQKSKTISWEKAWALYKKK